MSGKKIVMLIVIVIIGLIVLEFAGLGWTKFFAPKWEGVKREVFEATKSYNEGKEQDLLRYRLEYLRADSPEDKEALASTIRHMFTDYDVNKLSPELRSFLLEIKSGGF